ncbi:hypothetical protein K438DRAFT_1938967 [Mycena galopus ATCC 62051]|nr:hypothetical protein K438DRAFT_1938967 [Mycena galopus ATCC 62051]
MTRIIFEMNVEYLNEESWREGNSRHEPAKLQSEEYGSMNAPYVNESTVGSVCKVAPREKRMSSRGLRSTGYATRPLSENPDISKQGYNIICGGHFKDCAGPGNIEQHHEEAAAVAVCTGTSTDDESAAKRGSGGKRRARSHVRGYSFTAATLGARSPPWPARRRCIRDKAKNSGNARLFDGITSMPPSLASDFGLDAIRAIYVSANRVLRPGALFTLIGQDLEANSRVSNATSERKTACLHRLGQHRYGQPSSTPDEVRACQILNVTALWDVEDGGEDSDGIESEDEEEEDDVFQIIEAVECAGNHRAGDEEGDFWV